MSLFKYKMESIDRSILEYAEAVERGNAFAIEQTKVLTKIRDAYSELVELTKQSTTLYVVSVEHPYTNCCESGPLEKEVVFASFDLEKAKNAASLFEKTGQSLVSIDDIEAYS